MVLRIRITNKCNLQCKFCYLASNLNTGENECLDVSEWNKVINNLPRWTIVDITGAEPFLATNFSTILSMLLDRKLKISLITNGMIINDTIISNFVKKRLFFLMLSVDGAEERHNELRGNGKSFANIVKFIERVNYFKEKYKIKYPLLCIKTTIIGENVDDLQTIGDMFLGKLKVDQHTLNMMFQNESRSGSELATDVDAKIFDLGNTFSYEEDSHNMIISKIEEYLKYAKLKKWITNIKPEVSNQNWREYILHPKGFGVKRCNRYYSISTIYYDGTLSPCDINYMATNIRDLNYDLKRIWKNDRYSHFINSNMLGRSFIPSCDACCLAEQSRKDCS